MSGPQRPGAPERVLVVEDDRSLRGLLVDDLGEQGLEVRAVRSAEEALPVLDELEPSLVLSDLRLPGMTGVDLLAAVRARPRALEPAFVVITAFGSIAQAVQALKQGADDFLTKPLDFDHLRVRVSRLLDVQRLKREVVAHRLRREVEFHGMLGRSAAMQATFEQVRTMARGRGPVLVSGESGVGKELVARAIHRESGRRDGPFVPVNCAGIPESLMESEFFGHEPGAFTGATRQREGLFAAAEGGTLLLDEVGELPLALQAKLLRVLQEGTVRRVGSDRTVALDVRVLVATNRDLEHEVAEGRFREDLFYRLATFILEVPPLRRRREDVELLAVHFLERFASDAGRAVDGFDDEALELLAAYPFPGNVRELENLVEHAVTFCRERVIAARDLPARVLEWLGARRPARDAEPSAWLEEVARQGNVLPIDEMVARYVRHVVALTSGNKRRAAALLGISRQTLYRHLARAAAAPGDDPDPG